MSTVPEIGTRPSAHETLTDFAADEIRKRIIVGTLPPGTRLRVDSLAAQLGISRIPLREAFRQLLAEGLVVMYPRRGAVVADIDRDDVDDCFRMLELLEVMALERAAATSLQQTAAAMKRELDRMARLDAGADPVERLRAHRAFHFAMFSSLGSGALRRQVHIVWHACERYITVATQTRSTREADGEHAQLLACFARGDVAGSTALARHHVERSHEAALRGLGFLVTEVPPR